MRRRSFALDSAASRSRRQKFSRLGLEAMEDRRLLTTLFVTNTNDLGDGSLRSAIVTANTTPGSDTIDFNITGTGVQTITLGSALPQITDTLLIDGTTQGNNPSNPLIFLDGSALGAGNNGLSIAIPTGTSPATIRGLAIGNFQGAGVAISGTGGNAVQDSLIGVNATGLTAAPNGVGVSIVNSTNNTIGGIPSGAFQTRNVISGNTGPGVSISGASSSGNLVEGNTIGLDVNGAASVSNGNGVVIQGASSNTIGGAVVAARNVISGNGGANAGVLITDAGASNNTVLGNYIGLNASGTAAVGNGTGVEIANGASNNTVGGTVSTNQNVISGNTSSNILITGASNNLVVGNTVGLNSAGSLSVGVQATVAGIEIDNGATGNTIGSITASAQNVVSGATGPGIQVQGRANGYTGVVAANNLIQGNTVGTDILGTVAIPSSSGVVLTNGTTGNTVGGTAAGARNVISGNSGVGVFLSSAGTTGNFVQGNDIGVQGDSMTALANGSYGVYIDGASGNQVGGTATGAGNVISANTSAGVFINSGTGDQIRRNVIFNNGGLGIDLAPLGVNNNIATSPGNGPNTLINFPVITKVSTVSGTTTITGTYSGIANTSYALDFYSDVTPDPSGHGEGRVFLGTTNITTDASGNATFTATTTTSVAVGPPVTGQAIDGSGNSSEFSANVTASTPTVDLAVVLFASPNPVGVNGLLTYTIGIVNGGASSASNVVVTDTLPAGVTFQGATSTVGSVTQSGTTVTATVGALAPGATATITITVVPTTTGTITNNVTSTSTETDANAANNSASIQTSVIAGVDLVVTSSVSPFPATVGSPVAFTVVVTNNSTTTSATNVQLTAPLPAGATVVSSSSSQGQTATTATGFGVAFGTLAPGASASTILVLNPTTTGTLQLIATATSTEPDLTPSANFTSPSVTVQAASGTNPTGDGPQITNLTRSNFHAIPANIALSFNGALTPAPANSLANYSLVEPGRDGKFNTKDDVKVTLASATYDATTNVVNLRTKRTLPLHQKVQLTVNGTTSTGITGTNGLLLDGNNDGVPGGNFVEVFSGTGPGTISTKSVRSLFVRKK